MQQTLARLGTPDCPVVHWTVPGGALDSVRCARLVRVNSPLSGLDGGVRLKITGPSSESSAANSSPSGKAKGRRGYNSPDCPVVHRTVR
jgi:hypothetical protein